MGSESSTRWINLKIDGEVHRELKHLCVEASKTQAQVLERLVREAYSREVIHVGK